MEAFVVGDVFIIIILLNLLLLFVDSERRNVFVNNIMFYIWVVREHTRSYGWNLEASKVYYLLPSHARSTTS